MIIAIPIFNNQLDAHFGHCKEFALLDVDVLTKNIINRRNINAPLHEPGLLPKWLAEFGVNLVIAGGIGQKAQTLLQEKSIAVVVGAFVDTPENLVTKYLNGDLITGENCCDH